MELPCSVVFAYFFWYAGPKRKSKAQLVLGTMFSLHYAYRGWYYPFFNVRPSPNASFDLPTALASWIVTVTHGYLNAKWIGVFGPFKSDSHLRSATFWVGAAIYYTGFALIVRHDSIMRALREAPNAPRYSIPRGWLWEYSANAHYLSELIAWFGWATATGFGPNAFVFFVSCFNLVPRAATNFAWYEDKFGDEFRALNRAVLVPGVW